MLYGKLRPYLNKVVVAEKAGYCTTEIVPLRPAHFTAAAFLRVYLRSQTFLDYAAQKNYGMKMPRLGTQDLESAMIPLPPLAEQKRIVAKVDELMALCDRLEAQQQEREARHAVLARAALARFPAAINQACAAVCPLDGTPPMQGYLKLLLEKQYDEIRSLSAGGAQPNLNVQKIKEAFVPLPPLAEQRRIVAKVSELMALVDELEAQLAASRATGANLLSAVVAELTGPRQP